MPFRYDGIQTQRRVFNEEVVMLERLPKSKIVSPKIKVKKEKKRKHWPSKNSNLWNIHMCFVNSLLWEISLDRTLSILDVSTFVLWKQIEK